MNALSYDALQQLANSGAEVVGQTGDPRDGFRFDYKTNKSVGTLTVSPLSITPPSLIRRKMSLPDGMRDVSVTIEQTERWFPKGAGTIQITVTSFVH